jgi:hypothetical protein
MPLVIPQIDIVKGFINVNRALTGGLEEGVNAGTFVRWILAVTGNQIGAPWCAAGQTKAGVALLGSRWPVPRTAEVKGITDWARKNHCLMPEPALGALMAFWHEKDSRGPRFAHIGAVLEILAPKRVRTSEGNTSGGPAAGGKVVREGNGFYEKIRDVQPKDAFVYWWLMLSSS